MSNVFGVADQAIQNQAIQNQALQNGIQSADAAQKSIENFRAEMQRIAAASTQDSIKNDAITKMLNEAKQTSQAFSRS